MYRIQRVPLATRPEHKENGVHCSTIINAFTMRTQRVTGFVLRDKWRHFFPKFIADLPLAVCHMLLLEIAITYLTDKSFWDRF